MALGDDLNSVQSALTCYALPIILILGVFGNFVNILVFSQKHLRISSCAIYFISTSIFNILVMTFGIPSNIVIAYTAYDFASYSAAYCKLRSYLIHVLFMISRSAVALACIDRFALCSSNVRIRAFSQRSMAIKMVLIASIVWFVIPSHMIVYVDIQMPNRRCGGSGNYSYIYGLYAAIVTTIPLIIMVVFSTLAIRSLKHIQFRVQPDPRMNGQTVPKNIRIQKRDVKLTLILIGEVIIYFCSTVSFPIYSIYAAITATVPKDTLRTAIESFMRYNSLNFLIYVNAASIFYIHLLASGAFRKESKQVLFRIFKNEENRNVWLSTAGMTNTKSRFGKRQQQQMETSFKK
ncbi:unnamed protein product [Adineta ricciae]|uniref:G-protein coupled receptors family 1 profile domain-containing protein n=1 Tax=Adineta ricciae TaxID=249248 RepID=A0A814UVX1_ADIRI|nr:unnamed protein product [Adineta ricciae]CAF1177336.1 unnamed protein product [Adineta ricciae]